MNNFEFQEQLAREVKRVKDPNTIVGRGSMMPFNAANSGSRKLMNAVHVTHILEPFNPEAPYIMTGRENKFAQFSSALQKAKSDYQIITKIDKFSFDIKDNYGMHYWLIVYDVKNETYGVIERKSYEYVSETYGYLYDNEFIDSLSQGDWIAQNEVIKKSISYDDAGNRADGHNLLVMYLSDEDTREDAIKISDEVVDLFTSPEFKPVSFMINDNDIPLNLYGDKDFYQSFPNIGEEVKGSILCAMRKEKKDQAIYSQSVGRLQEITMSDEKFIAEGEVIDINIYCNDPSILEQSHYNAQLKFYYEESLRVAREIVSVVGPLIKSNKKMTPELQKLYAVQKSILSGKKFVNDRGKVFTNTMIEIIVMNRNKVNDGDKFANRYGGKGCTSTIVPREEMPILPDGRRVQMVLNTSGVPNRENAGQIFEVSVNMRSNQLIRFLREQKSMSVDKKFEMILGFLEIVAPKMHEAYQTLLDSMTPNGNFEDNGEDYNNAYTHAVFESRLEQLMDDILKSDCLNICVEPITETMDLNKIDELNRRFPFMQQIKPLMPMRDSNNNLRFTESRKKMTVGYEYIYRMKQYASEKFSATSLASTNIKNLPTRNSFKKTFKTLHASTPICMGTMETFDLLHIGPEYVICNLLLNSLSPHGRRLAEELLTGNPYDIDLKLDGDCANRSVEILNAYLMTMGLELKFVKKKKEIAEPVTFTPIAFSEYLEEGIKFLDNPEVPMEDYVQKLIDNEQVNILFEPIWFEED